MNADFILCAALLPTAAVLDICYRNKLLLDFDWTLTKLGLFLALKKFFFSFLFPRFSSLRWNVNFLKTNNPSQPVKRGVLGNTGGVSSYPTNELKAVPLRRHRISQT